MKTHAATAISNHSRLNGQRPSHFTMSRMTHHASVNRILRQTASVTNLAVSSPGSRQERIAESTADAIMALSPSNKSQPHGETPPRQLSATPSTGEKTTPVGPALATHIRNINGGGQSLPATERAFFESHLQRDLSRVRVHTDARAARLTRHLHADAFTLGNDIVFRPDKYRPGNPDGRHLLAHELVHVTQQAAARGGSEVIQRQCSGRLGSCDYYDCREERHPCGSDGYYLGYGGKYCNRFNTETRPGLSNAGKVWVDMTTRCLQRYLENNVPYDADCADVQRRAFDSHPDCYVSAGICDLPVSDWWKIFWTVDASDMEARQAWFTAISCPGEWWEDMERNMGYYLSPESLPEWMGVFGATHGYLGSD